MRRAYLDYEARARPSSVPFFNTVVAPFMVYQILNVTRGNEEGDNMLYVTAYEHTRLGDFLREVRFRIDRSAHTARMLLDLIKQGEQHPLFVRHGAIFIGTEGLKQNGSNKRYQSYVFMKKITRQQRKALEKRGLWPYDFSKDL